MGIQDRDYYWEKRDQIERAGRPAAVRRGVKSAKRIPVDLLDNANPPALWGADWHWSLKLLVWLLIAVLLAVLVRLLRP